MNRLPVCHAAKRLDALKASLVILLLGRQRDESGIGIAGFVCNAWLTVNNCDFRPVLARY